MRRFSVIYGFWTAVALIVYFLLIKLVGFQENVMFSAVNGIIFGVGIYITISRLNEKLTTMKYETGFSAGMVSGAVATAIFTMFMAIYMYQIDPGFPKALMQRWNLEDSLSTAMLVLMILTMGAVTTLVLTLAFMQLFKQSWNTKEGDAHTLK